MLLGAAMSGPRWGWGYCPGWGYGGWGHHQHFDSHVHNSTEINNTYITNETNNITNNYNGDGEGGEMGADQQEPPPGKGQALQTS